MTTIYDAVIAGYGVRRAWVAEAKSRRYNVWALALSASASLALWVVAVVIGWLYSWLWALAAGVVMLPVPVYVVSLSWVAASVEWKRLNAELLYFDYEPELPTIPAEVGPSPQPESLRPGWSVNGEVMPPPPEPLSEDKKRLRDACIKLIEAGRVRGKFTRGAIAEGDKALLSGTEWDMASAELQKQGWFMADVGKGLTPKLNVDLGEVIKRLESAA